MKIWPLCALVAMFVIGGCASRAPSLPPGFDAGHLADTGVDAPPIIVDAGLEDGGANDAALDEDAALDAEIDAGFLVLEDAGDFDAWMPCTDDLDFDGDRSIECGGTDCDDSDPARSGLRPEVCGNAIDEDCSGVLDDLFDTVTCDLQVLCRDPSCFCDGGCTVDMCVEAVRSGYVEYYRCANAPELAAAYLADCGASATCVDLVSCVANILIATPDLCVCPETFPRCSGRCTDLTTDNGSCGMCGHACTGSSVCEEGSCVHCGGDGESCCFGLSGMNCEAGLICYASFICGM